MRAVLIDVCAILRKLDDLLVVFFVSYSQSLPFGLAILGPEGTEKPCRLSCKE